jgi:hypothetical protein
MSRAELEHVLARGLEGKKIRLKNNKLRLSAALHRAIHNSISQNGLAGYLRQCVFRSQSHLETCIGLKSVIDLFTAAYCQTYRAYTHRATASDGDGFRSSLVWNQEKRDLRK